MGSMARGLLNQRLNQRLIPRLIPICCMEDIMDTHMPIMDIMDILMSMARGLLNQRLNQRLIPRLIPTCCMEDTMDIHMPTMDIMDTHMDIIMESKLNPCCPCSDDQYKHSNLKDIFDTSF